MIEPNTWRTATIFISSTFKDMQFERDCINREIVPALKEFFVPYRITVRCIDLRWGVNTKDRNESEVEQSILNVCMDEIDRSRPFFVGLLGYRYGWVPNLSDDNRSVTEMEIAYGAMRDSNSKKSSIFCLRNLIHSPNYATSIYYEESSEAQEKINNLRDYVRSELCEYPDNIKMYDVKLDESGCVYGLDDFKDYLTKQLKKIICEQFGVDQSTSYIYENDNKCLKEKFDSYLSDIQYIQRDNKVEELILHTSSDSRAYLIWGNEACGKSAMLCYLYRVIETEPNTIPLYYNAALSTGLYKQLELLNFWNYQLSEKLDYSFEEINLDTGVERVFSRAILVDYDIIYASKKLRELCKIAQEKGYKVVFFIDDADELCGTEYLKQLFNILPLQHLFLSAKNKSASKDCQYYHPSPFAKGEIIRYLKAKFEYYNKELHKNVVDAIINKIANVKGNQLWLDIVSYLLLNLDAEDFKKIADIDSLSEEEKIETYFLSVIDLLPTDIEKLFMYVYRKCEKYFKRDLVYGCMRYISISRNGLRDNDLSYLLGDIWSPIDFANFRRWFSPFIVESYDNKCWKFISTTFQKAMSEVDASLNDAISREIASMLWNYEESDAMRRSELFYNLVRCAMFDKASDVIIKENKFYSHSIMALLKGIDDVQFESLFYSLLKISSNEERVVCACQILLHFRFDIFINDINFGNKLLRVLLSSIDLKNNILSEYAYVCLAALLENVSHYVVTEDKLYYGEILYQINTIRHNNYPSEKSRDVLTTSIYILASNYMKCGNINKAQEYFLKLQSI